MNKIMGSKETGSKANYMMQLTSIFLALTTFWFVYVVVQITQYNMEKVMTFVLNPIHVSIFMMFLIVSVYHGVIGMKSVFDDYIHCKLKKAVALFVLYAFSFMTVVITIVAVVGLHITIRMLG